MSASSLRPVVRMKKRAWDAAVNTVNRMSRRRPKVASGFEARIVEFNATVNGLSNWERNQWARDGYPGLRKKDPTGPAAYLPVLLGDAV